MAVFSLAGSIFQPVLAQTRTRPELLYKVQSRWTDIASDGSFIYLTNSTYSQVEIYQTSGAFFGLFGQMGDEAGRLSQPMGLTIGTSTATYYLYVADTGNSRIQKFNATTGALVDSWGSYGTGDGQLIRPEGVAVDDAETYMFVADTGNNRIHAIELSGGTFASKSGTLGSGATQFSSPKGIAVMGTAPSFLVFVADTGNNRVVVYNYDTTTDNFSLVDPDDYAIGSYGTTSTVDDVRFSQPNKVWIDKSTSHYVYVTDATNRIQQFTNGRVFIRQWNVHDLHGTTGITSFTTLGGSPVTTLYAIEPLNQVDVYSQAGSYITKFYYEANEPVDIARDQSGNLYINNNYTDSVMKFNSSWAPVTEWYGDGLARGVGTAFSGALGIGVNTDGEVCIADTGNNRVQRFESDGTFHSNVPTPMVTPTGFYSPKDAAMENTGQMYVSDTLNNRILKYDSLNVPLWAIGEPTPTFTLPGPGTPTPTTPAGPYFLNPYGITVDTQNKVYVADSGHHRILKFQADGTIDPSNPFWGEYGSADNKTMPQFYNPQGMAIQETGVLGSYYIYVADTGNNRIQRFDQNGSKDPLLDVWGEYGSDDGQFDQPRNISLDDAGRIYVSEVGNKRIQVFGNPTLEAGIYVEQTGGTAVKEDGSIYDSYTVRLLTQPTASVTVTIASSDSTQVTTSAPSLTFTKYNWNVPQVITVLPVHDFIDQADTQSFTLSHSVASADTNYDSSGTSLSDVLVTYTDTDSVKVNVNPLSLSVDEDGIGFDGGPGEPYDSYIITLDTKPTADLIITPVSSDGYTTISPSSCTFTASNWNDPDDCTFNVSAVHDEIANATRSANIDNNITTSDTSGYQNISPASVSVLVEDFVDLEGITISAQTVPIYEGGAPGTYTVYLNSKPTADVTINISTPSGTTDVSFVPTTLTFTPVNYNTEQTVMLYGMQDFIASTSGTREVDLTNTSQSSDPGYNGSVQFWYNGGYSSNIVTASIIDIDEAGVAFAETDGKNYLIEGYDTHTYEIVLLSKPLSNVVFTARSDTNATTSAYIHTFTPANWNIPQELTISAANDSIYYGTHSASIIHTIESSSDPNYPAFTEDFIFSYTFYDTDFPDIVFNLPNGAINVMEGAWDDQYYMKLKTQPLDDVTINISGGADATVTPSSLVFTPANWNVEQIATVAAINNYIVDGPHTGTLTHTVTSPDPGYDGLTSALIINIADDDSIVPGVQITQTNGETKVYEGGATDTYTMQLTSKPTYNVRIRVISDNWEATTSAAFFSFTTSNWNAPQTVTIRAIDDSTADGDKTSIFRHIATSMDPHYNYIPIEDVTVIASDNDGSSGGGGSARAPQCGDTPPNGVPNLFQIDARSTTAKLYFTPLRDNINYYFIAYGYTLGDIRFGVSFPFGSYDGVIDYTINMLDPGSTYYFKVRGGNGCATGEWSQSLSATTTATGSAYVRSYYASSSSYSTSTGGGTYSGGSTGGVSADGTHPIFTRDLYPGARGADVRSLQIYLNQKGFIVAQSGAGSPGNETDYYGPLTAAAVRRFQEAHYAEILSPLGYSSGTGIFGPSTRAYVNSH